MVLCSRQVLALLVVVELLEIQPGHQTAALARRRLPTLSAGQVVAEVQVLVPQLATEAQAATQQAVVAAAVLATQLTPVLVVMVATAMSVS